LAARHRLPGLRQTGDRRVDAAAMRTDPAAGLLLVLAEERAADRDRQRPLADALGPAQQQRGRQPPLAHGPAEDLADLVVAEDVIEHRSSPPVSVGRR